MSDSHPTMTTSDTMPPVLPATPETVSGAAVRVQRFVGRHCVATLILGDSETMDRIEADALVTDPPYGTQRSGIFDNERWNGGEQTAKSWTSKSWGEMHNDDKPFDPARWLKYPIVILWGANYYQDRLPSKRGMLIWDKTGGGIGGAAFKNDGEIAWTNGTDAVRIFSHLWNGYKRASEIGQHMHPTQKPVALMAWAMDKAKIPQGATVLDPYMGSGSTGIACLRTGRNFIGVERDAAHYKTACDRIAHELDGALL